MKFMDSQYIWIFLLVRHCRGALLHQICRKGFGEFRKFSAMVKAQPFDMFVMVKTRGLLEGRNCGLLGLCGIKIRAKIDKEMGS